MSLQEDLEKEGYTQIALSEGIQFGNAQAATYYNRKEGTFVVTVDDLMHITSIKRNQLEAIQHAIEDTLEKIK